MLLAETYECDSIVSPSRAARQALDGALRHVSSEFSRAFDADARYRGRLDVIPLCVDTEYFRPRSKTAVRALFRLPKDALIILCIGRLSLADKMDLLPLCGVFASLVEQNPQKDLLMVIAGHDPRNLGTVIQRRAMELGVGPKVRVLGEFPYEQVHLLHAAADIFVSPADNLQETSGLTPLEAMASGVPQVVADWDGYREAVVHGETGFLVRTNWAKCDGDLCDASALRGWEFDYLSMAQSVAVDVGELKSYLQTLIDNPTLREEMGHRSQARAKAVYSYPVVVEKYEALWKELLEQARYVKRETRRARYNRPTYYEVFGHYASNLIADDTPVQSTAPATKALGGRRVMPGLQEVWKSGAVNEEVLRSLIAELDARTRAIPAPEKHREDTPFCGSMPLGELAHLVASRMGCHPDLVRRHVLWLIKYGLAQIAGGPEH